jgi:hypothetical protein
VPQSWHAAWQKFTNHHARFLSNGNKAFFHSSWQYQGEELPLGSPGERSCRLAPPELIATNGGKRHDHNSDPLWPLINSLEFRFVRHKTSIVPAKKKDAGGLPVFIAG